MSTNHGIFLILIFFIYLDSASFEGWSSLMVYMWSILFFMKASLISGDYNQLIPLEAGPEFAISKTTTDQQMILIQVSHKDQDFLHRIVIGCICYHLHFAQININHRCCVMSSNYILILRDSLQNNKLS